MLRPVAEFTSAKSEGDRPLITVAIPHYKHRRYLEVVLESLFTQTFNDFEILVSDDCSPDDSSQIIPSLLQKSGREFRYYTQPINLGYDGNVRFCLAAAEGRYVFLLGNDDALTQPDTLERVAKLLRELRLPEVAFTNFEDWSSAEVTRRARATRVVGVGPRAAVAHFRSFSFVSGLIFGREAAVEHETNQWDKSIYYQIYLACRIMASGGRLGALDLSAVRKDVTVDGQTVPTSSSKWANEPWSFQSRHTGLDSVIRVTAAAVLPLVLPAEKTKTLRRIISKVFLSAYPFWIFHYRSVSNWSFAAGIARDMWPRKLLDEYDLPWIDRLSLWLLYLSVTMTGLLTPIALLDGVSRPLADFFRRQQQSQSSRAQ